MQGKGTFPSISMIFMRVPLNDYENCIRIHAQAASFDLTIMSRTAKLYKNGFLCWFYVQPCCLCLLISPHLSILAPSGMNCETFSNFYQRLSIVIKVTYRKSKNFRKQSNISSSARFGYKKKDFSRLLTKNHVKNDFLSSPDRVDFKWDFFRLTWSLLCTNCCA